MQISDPQRQIAARLALARLLLAPRGHPQLGPRAMTRAPLSASIRMLCKPVALGLGWGTKRSTNQRGVGRGCDWLWLPDLVMVVVVVCGLCLVHIA